MATDQLKEVIERVEKLSPENRENIVKEILRKIEAAEWDDKDYLTDTDADLEKLFRV